MVTLLYIPAVYIVVNLLYYSKSVDFTLNLGIILSIVIWAVVSFAPTFYLLIKFGYDCKSMIDALELKEEKNIILPEEIESREQERESRHEDPECIEDSGSRQEEVDRQDHPKKIIDSFNALTRAWSPMLAITFATESVVLISSGVAMANLALEYIRKLIVCVFCDYENRRNYLMMCMAIYCGLYFLTISWIAEETHKFVKKFGTKIR